jgi:hypothetical protein
MDVYERALQHILKADKNCKELAARIEKYIPENACDKGRLLAMILGKNLSSAKRLDFIVQAQIDYLNSLYGGSPDDSVISDAHQREINFYKARQDALHQHYKGRW